MSAIFSTVKSVAAVIPQAIGLIIGIKDTISGPTRQSPNDFCQRMAEQVLVKLGQHIERSGSSLTFSSEQKSSIEKMLYNLFTMDSSIALYDRITESENEGKFIDKLIHKLSSDLVTSSDQYITQLVNSKLRSAILKTIAEDLRLFRLKSSKRDCSDFSSGNSFYYIAWGEIDYRETEVLCAKFPKLINTTCGRKGYVPLHYAIMAQKYLKKKFGNDSFNNIIKVFIANGASPSIVKKSAKGLVLKKGIPTLLSPAGKTLNDLIAAYVHSNEQESIKTLINTEYGKYLKLNPPDISGFVMLSCEAGAAAAAQLSAAIQEGPQDTESDFENLSGEERAAATAQSSAAAAPEDTEETASPAAVSAGAALTTSVSRPPLTLSSSLCSSPNAQQAAQDLFRSPTASSAPSFGVA